MSRGRPTYIKQLAAKVRRVFKDGVNLVETISWRTYTDATTWLENFSLTDTLTIIAQTLTVFEENLDFTDYLGIAGWFHFYEDTTITDAITFVWKWLGEAISVSDTLSEIHMFIGNQVTAITDKIRINFKKAPRY